MTRRQEQIEFLSASSASLLSQLNELDRLREQIRQAQAVESRDAIPAKPKIQATKSSGNNTSPASSSIRPT
jgi:hypothetical protein